MSYIKIFIFPATREIYKTQFKKSEPPTGFLEFFHSTF